MYLEVVTREPAVQIITAGRKGEPVLEEEGHGLFTRRLLHGLKGLADTDQNGVITAQELATWLESRVIRDSQSRQHPQYSRLDGEGQFVFVVAPREQRAEDLAKGSEPQAIAKLPSPTAPSRPATVVPSTAELPKYSVGDSWTLQLSDDRTITRKIRGMDNDLYVWEWAQDRWRYFDRDLVLKKETSSTGKSVISNLLNRRLMDFPLSVNKAWEFSILTQTRVGWYGTETTRWHRVFKFKVVAVETIRTAAGAFDAFKIEEKSHEIMCTRGPCETTEATSVVRHWWYAPEVKFFVKVVNVSGHAAELFEPDYEIVAFNLK